MPKASTTAQRKASPSLLYAQLAAYAAVALLLLPSVRLAPVPLDDLGQLQALAQAAFSQVLAVDRFGHLRPLKSALFWVLSRHPEGLLWWRAAALLCVLASARLWQLLCAKLLGSEGWALIAALCWALNPVTASCLSWLSSTNLVLAGLGMLSYVWLLDRNLSRAQPKTLLMLAAYVSLCVALLSHELAWLAPVLFVLYRRCRLAEAGASSPPAERRRTLQVALASLACSAALWLGLYVLSPTRGIDYRAASYPRAQLLLNAPRYLNDNLRLWLWLPGKFGVLIPGTPLPERWVGIVGWAAFTVLCLLLWQKRARDAVLTFSVLVAALMLLPLSNFIPLGNTPVALHYLYLPGLGLALLLTRLAERAQRTQPIQPRLRASWLPAALLLLLMAAWLPAQRQVLAFWSDATSVYTETIRNYPDNIEARVNLAAIYLDTQRYAEADALLADSLKRAPNEVGLIFNRFKLLADTGKLAEALAFFADHPQLDMPSTQLVRAVLLLRMQRDALASEAFGRALELATQPDERLAAGRGLVLTLVRTGEHARAQRVVERLIAEFPDQPELRFMVP